MRLHKKKSKIFVIIILAVSKVIPFFVPDDETLLQTFPQHNYSSFLILSNNKASVRIDKMTVKVEILRKEKDYVYIYTSVLCLVSYTRAQIILSILSLPWCARFVPDVSRTVYLKVAPG